MNRLKLWLFALLVMGLAAAGMRWLVLDLRRAAIEGLDDRLAVAQERVEGAEQALTAKLTAVAALAAQDRAVLDRLRPQPEPVPATPAIGRKKTLPPPPPAADPAELDAALSQAAANAVTAAESALGTTLGRRDVVVVTRDGLARLKAAGTDAEVLAYLQDALDRKVRRGFVLDNGKLSAGAAVPAGEGALAVFTRVDGAWVSSAVARTGAGMVLALLVKDQTPIASARGPGELLELAQRADAAGKKRAARAGGGTLAPVDVGVLPGVDVSPSIVKLPRVSSLLGALPADRVVLRPLAGVPDGRMLFAASTTALLSPLVRLEWYVLAALAAALLLTIIFTFLVKPTEVAAPVPSALVDVAAKIERGDWSARAPALAGKVGTVAAALNRAAEAAQRAEAGPTTTQEFFAQGAAAEPAPADDPFAFPGRAGRAAAAPAPGREPQAVSDTARLDGKHLTGSAFEAAPVAAARAVPEPAPKADAEPPAAVAAPAASPADLLGAAARAAPPAGISEEEQHWRDTFRDFVRTRGECGESAEGLTYERFRQKLETNKATLVAKYGCKTVRFQVYVKEGKAALKATPVR